MGAIRDLRARDRESVVLNVRTQLGSILKEPSLKAKVDAGELLVVG